MGDFEGWSDLGRRVARRRSELGLSIDQLADRSGMTPGYVEYLEHHAANVTAEALVRLASALDTTSAALLGQGLDRPADAHDSGRGPGRRPGRRQGRRPGRRPRIDRLTEAECRSLIAPGGVGRVVFSTDHGPEALPVNYSFVRGALVFRTAPNTPLADVVGTDVGFEIDRLDEALCEGWSVLISGPASRITEPALVWQIADAVKSWAGVDRDIFVRVELRRISGRRIGSGDRR
jgi:transcriptional regulator with XRE-family HTH domain